MKFKHLLGPLPNMEASAFVTAIFLIFFAALCWFVYRKERRAIYETLGRLPLEEDTND